MTAIHANDLISKFHAAVMMSDAAINAIPDGLSDRDADLQMDAALAPVTDLVGRIADMPATDAHVVAVKAMAVAWHDGRYHKLQHVDQCCDLLNMIPD